MLKTKILVWRSLTQPKQMEYVRKIPALVVKHCFSPPNWLGCTKFNMMDWFYNLLPIIFSISFPRTFKRTIGQNIFGEL